MILVRGGGDIATGSIYKLHRCGYRVLVLETKEPAAIRRKAAFCEAVYDGIACVEGVVCQKADTIKACEKIWEEGKIPLMTDPQAQILSVVKPEVVVDGILAKKNLGTNRNMAPLTIGLGPGFCAGTDVDYVIETMRGHQLGRIITKGCALPNTGVPGIIGGYGAERVIHAPVSGRLRANAQIGDLVEEGDLLAVIGETQVKASLTGVLRGIIRDGFLVHEGLKIADIDPRKEQKENCSTISDKARCIAGGVLEVVVCHGVKREQGRI